MKPSPATRALCLVLAVFALLPALARGATNACGTAENAAAGQPGRPVTVAGPIREMTDSVVQAWIAEGAITADQEMEARYAESYMDAWYVSSGQQAAASTAAE